MHEKSRKSLILLVNKMMVLGYSQETIEQTLYVLRAFEKDYLKEGIEIVDKMLDEKPAESLYWSNMSQYSITKIRRHNSEELKQAIEKRKEQRIQSKKL